MAYSPENPNSLFWDREFEMELPDSRLSGPERRRSTVVYDGKLYEKVFCGNCGADGGLVTAEWTPHIFYLCHSCVAKHGPPAGCREVDPVTEAEILRKTNGPPLQ